MITTPVHRTAVPFPQESRGPIDDQILVLRIREGSGAAFEVLCDRYGRRLHRVALRILHNEADAEDVVQESLLRAFTKISTFRGEAGIYTWLVSIVINTSLMTLRKRARYPTNSLDHSDPTEEGWMHTLRHTGEDPETSAIRRQESLLLRDAVEQLPIGYRLLLGKWLLGRASIHDLSTEFDLSVPATKSRLIRGREKLQDKLKGDLQSARKKTKSH